MSVEFKQAGEVILCYAHGTKVGAIMGSFVVRKLSFYPEPIICFDSQIMRAIADKLDELNGAK